MAPSRGRSRTGKTGITHFPLEDEQARQEQVPPRGKTKRGAPPATGSTNHGHRLSRSTGRKSPSESDNAFEGRGAKGGKSRGSRAGLLSAGRKGKGRASR
ncbi:MAG TPA: hypothetical protein VJ746_02980 [Nitrospira sp.]|nr:hypothetical protein [Nitrospira sp.]